MTAQLPVADYVELKGTLEAMAATIGGRESELGHDERMGLALLSLARRGPSQGGGAAPGRVLVAHVGLVALLEHHHRLRAELERAGLISAEVLERLACDADRDGRPRRRGRAHDVRGPGPALPERHPAPRALAPRPALSLPGL